MSTISTKQSKTSRLDLRRGVIVNDETRSRPYFLYTLLASILLHTLILSTQFNLNPRPETLARDTGIDIVLLNHTQRQEEDNRAQLLAQYAQKGGGDDQQYAESPLPVSSQSKDGDTLEQARLRQAQLEVQQRELLTQLKNQYDREQAVNNNASSTQEEGDAELNSEVLARKYAAISARIADYQQRPKHHFYAPSTSEYRFAAYVDEWRQRIEVIGNKNYPKEARGKYYGSLRMTVFIKSDGQIEKIEFHQKAEHDLLNEAARRIIQLAAPFAAFPANIARDTDVLAITRTWHFKNATLTLDNHSP